MADATPESHVACMARDCVANRVRLLNRAVTAIYDEALRPYRLRISQMSVLVAVAMAGEVTPGRIGQILHMEKSTVSRALARLRARELLELVAAHDGRLQRVRITRPGRALLRKASQAWSRAQKTASGLLGDRGVEALTRAAGALSAARR